MAKSYEFQEEVCLRNTSVSENVKVDAQAPVTCVGRDTVKAK